MTHGQGSTYRAVLTVEEVANRLGVSVATIRRRCGSGGIAAEKVGGTWLVYEAELPRGRQRTRRRAPASVSSQLDLRKALTHLKSHDLVQDVWAPDILRFADELANVPGLMDLAASKLDLDEPFDPPTSVAVPKSPIFPRNATDLTLSDRLAFQAVVAGCSDPLFASAVPGSFGARASSSPRRFLANGRDEWLKWKRAVSETVVSGGPWMMETDITAFFDFVKHDLLLPELGAAGARRPVVDVLRSMLRTWSATPNAGLPQGPNASRLLADFYMSPVDLVMDGLQDVAYFRFRDDIRIVGRTRARVIGAIEVLDSECRRRGLALSAKKTALLHGDEAANSLRDSELDTVQYSFDHQALGRKELKRRLRSILKSALHNDGTIDARRARFSLARLLILRDRASAKQVIEHLAELAPLRAIAPMYLTPWLRRPGVAQALAEFLHDPERNTSSFLSAWILAVMLELQPPIPEAWATYARRVSQDRREPTFHRAVALNALALGQRGRDLTYLSDIIRSEYDPELVRAALVALARVGRLDKSTVTTARRIRGIGSTVSYLSGRTELPSVAFAALTVPVWR